MNWSKLRQYTVDVDEESPFSGDDRVSIPTSGYRAVMCEILAMGGGPGAMPAAAMVLAEYEASPNYGSGIFYASEPAAAGMGNKSVVFFGESTHFMYDGSIPGNRVLYAPLAPIVLASVWHQKNGTIPFKFTWMVAK